MKYKNTFRLQYALLFASIFFVLLATFTSAQYITTKLTPSPPYILSSEDVDPITVEVLVTFDFSTFTTNGVAPGKINNVVLNYAPQLAAFNSNYKIPCVNVDDPTEVLFEFGAKDGIAMHGVFNFKKEWKTTRTGGTESQSNVAVYQIPPGSHTCSMTIELQPQYAAYREYIGGAFANIPEPDVVYGYEIYDAVGRRVSSTPLDLPVPTFTLSTESLNSCYGDNTYCIFKLKISDFAFDAGTAGPQFKLAADFAKVPSYACFGEDGSALLATVPDETDYTSTILVPTLALYDLYQSGTVGEYLEAICVFDTGKLPTVSGSIMAEYTPMTNYVAGTKSLFKQPIMGPTALIYPHIQACYVGQECSYSLEFAENILSRSPLLKLTFPIPSEFKLTANDVCLLNQFDADTVYIQVLKRTAFDNGSPLRCTIVFTPTLAALKLTGLNTPAAILELGYHRLLSLKAYNLNENKVPDFDAYLNSLQNTAEPLDLTMYTESSVFMDTLLPFSPISNEQYLTLTPTQVGSCNGVEFCEVTYSFKSYYGIKRIRFPNYLRLTDGTMNQECRDATGVIGYMTLDPSLEYIYLTPVSKAGFTWGSCTLRFEMLVINNPGLIAYEYELSTYDALPHSKVENIYSLTSSQTIYDYVMHPSMTPFRLVAANFFQQTNTRNNWLTFNVQHGNPRAPVASTKSIELVFTSMTGGEFFQFSQASCFIPNSLNLQVGPSCTVRQNSPKSIMVEFNRQSNNLNTKLAQISWDSDQDLPMVLTEINVILEWTDQITGLPSRILSENKGLNQALVPFSPGNALIWANLQNPVRPTRPTDLLGQTVALFTGHTTSIILDIPGGFVVGSKLIFQLYHISPGRAAQTPLRIEFANNADLANYKLTPTTIDDTCVYCLAYIIGKNSDAVLNYYWYVQPLKQLPLMLTYLDAYSSFSTNSQVQLLVKVETGFNTLNWLALGSPIKQHITSTWQMPLSPNFVTYNYVVEKKNIFLRNGLIITAATAGDDSDISSFTGLASRQIITLQLQSSRFSTQMISEDILSTHYRYTFTGCRVWRYADQAGCVSSYDVANDITTVTCGDDRDEVQGEFNTLFTFYAPEQSTAQITCIFTAYIITSYTTGNNYEYNFPIEITFIPAVQQHTFMFAREALVCNTTEIPVAYLGGAGVYTLDPNSIDYSITPIETDDYSVTMDPNGRSIIFNAYSSSQKTKGVGTTTVALYAKLNCPLNGQLNAHETQWSFTYRGVNSLDISRPVNISPRNGFYIYSSPHKILDKMIFQLSRNAQREIIADPQNGATSDLSIYLYSSISAQYIMQISPPNRQFLFGILSSNRWKKYTYTTHGYDENGLPGVITKTTTANLWFASDVTRLELQLDSDVDLYDFHRWESYGSEFEYPTEDDVFNQQYGVRFPVIPYSRYQGEIMVSQCVLSACTTLKNFPLDIYLPLKVIFTFQPEVLSLYDSTLVVNRELAVGDSLTLTFQPNGLALETLTRENADGSIISITGDVTTGYTLKVVCSVYFPSSYIFSIPTSVDPVATTDATLISKGGSITFDSSLNYKYGDEIYTIVKEAQTATFSPLSSPVSFLQFPRGIRVGSDITIRFALGRSFQFSQRVQIGPLPFKPNLNLLVYSGDYLLSIVSSSNNPTDPRDASITIANRAVEDIPAGTILEFEFPFADFDLSFVYAEVHYTDPQYAVKFSSSGFGPASHSLPPYNALQHALDDDIGQSVEIWAEMLVTLRMVQVGTNYIPCRAGELCPMTLRLEQTDGSGYPLNHLQHFDILIDFSEVASDEFRLTVSANPPPVYQNKITTTEFGYQFEFIYLPDQLVIRVDVDPDFPGSISLQSIPIFVQFEASQQNGLVSMRVIKRSTLATLPLDTSKRLSDQMSDFSARTIYLDNIASGPSVASSAVFQPYFFYIDGGLFIDEPFTLGVAPSIQMSYSASLSTQRPQATTIVAEFRFDPAVDGISSWDVDMSYDEVLASVFDARRQSIATADAWNSTVFAELHPNGITFVLYQDGVTSNVESYVLSPRSDQRASRLFNFKSGFSFKSYAQDYKPGNILPDSTVPYITAQLSPDNMIVETATPIQGFKIRQTPWIRVHTKIFIGESSMDSLFIGFDGGTTLSLFIDMNFPSYKTDSAKKHKISQHDLLTMHIPLFYKVDIAEYTCQSSCTTGLCESTLVYNGDFFFFRFNEQLSTQYICSIPVLVETNTFYHVLANEGRTTPFPELTKSTFRYRAASALEPIILDESFNPVESTTPSDLPTQTSSMIWEDGDDETIEDKYLSFYLPMPMQSPLINIEYRDLTFVGVEAVLQVDIYNATLSSTISSSFQFTPPFGINPIDDITCVDQSSGITVARVTTSCKTTENPNCIKFTLVDSQMVPVHFQCNIKITPISEYAHYRKTEATLVRMSEAVPLTGLQSQYDLAATVKFTSTNPASKNILTLRNAKPTITLSGSLIEDMNVPLIITGYEASINPGDVVNISIGSRFRPVHDNWANVYCVDPSGNPAARISFSFNTKPFIFKNNRFDRDGNIDNVDQIATGFNLTYIGKAPLLIDESWTCSFPITPVDTKSSRLPAIFQYTKSATTGLSTTVEYKVINEFRVDRRTDVRFGFNANKQLAQAQSSVLLYFNSTNIAQTSSSPVLYIYLPIALLGLPETYPAQCALSTINADPATLPFRQLQITSSSSVYMIPLDRYIQYATDELSWVSCTLPNIQAGTQLATEAGRLEIGTTSVLLGSTFDLPDVMDYSIIQNGKTIVPLKQTSMDSTLENLENNTLVFNNLEPTPLDFVVVNSVLGQIASPISNSRVSIAINSNCVSTEDNIQTIAQVRNNVLVSTTVENGSNTCKATIIPTVIRVADVTLTGLVTTPIYPAGCGTAVNPVYCTFSTKMNVYMENSALPKYFQYAANITFTPKVMEVVNVYPKNFHSAASWAVDFSGFYPGSTVQLVLNPSVVAVSGVKFKLSIADTRVVVADCPTIDGIIYTCTLDATNTPFWKTLRAIVLYQVDSITAPASEDTVGIFTIKINQSAVLSTAAADSVVLYYDRKLASFSELSLAHIQWLIATGKSEPFSKFIQDSSTNPTILIYYPSSAAASITSTEILLPRGKMLDYGFTVSLLSIHAQTIIVPLASIIEKTVPAGAMEVEQAITTLFVSPYGADFTDNDTDKSITVKTKCVDRTFDKDASLFDITLYLSRTGTVPQVVAEFDMVQSNVASYFSVMKTTYDVLSCDFALSFIGHDQAVDLAPPIPLDENITPITADLDDLYVISYTPSQTIYSSTYDPFGVPQISNGMVLFHKFDNAFYNKPSVSIELEKEVLSLGSLGSMRVNIDTINVANGDILLIKFTPTVPESLTNSEGYATNADEATFTGQGSYTDFLINDGAHYGAIRQQKYQFTAPTMDNSAALCYNTFYDNSTTPHALATLTALNPQFNTILGGASDIFMLNLTQPPKYGSSSFLFTQFQCDVKLYAQHSHPFDGVITAQYITRAHFEAMQHTELNSPERTAFTTSLLPSNTANIVGKVSNPITRGFDIRISAAPTRNPREVVEATIYLSSSPPQHNIFLTINFTDIKPQSFFGCEGASVKFADWYGQSGGITNELYDNLLRLFITYVGENTTELVCNFLSSDITPIEYREALDGESTPKYKADPESRPAYPLHFSAYKLISRANIVSSTWLNDQQKALLAPLYQPETFEEFLNVPFFKLAPIAEYEAYFRTTFEEPSYTDAMIFYVANRNSLNPYFSSEESTRFLDTMYSTIALHVGSGLFMKFGNNTLTVLSESYTRSTGVLTLVIGYVSNNPISGYRGIIAPDSANIIVWVSRFEALSGQRIVHENSLDALSSRWPTTNFPAVVSNNKAAAIYLNSIMTMGPVYSKCVLGQTGGNCRRSAIGLPCSRNDDCFSSSCSIAYESKNESSPQSIQYGITAVPGTCVENLGNISNMNNIQRYTWDTQTALMQLYYQSDYYKSVSGLTISQNIVQKHNVMRYYATSGNEREYAQQMYHSVLGSDADTQALFVALVTPPPQLDAGSLAIDLVTNNQTDSVVVVETTAAVVDEIGSVQLPREHSSVASSFSSLCAFILIVMSMIFVL